MNEQEVVEKPIAQPTQRLVFTGPIVEEGETKPIPVMPAIPVVTGATKETPMMTTAEPDLDSMSVEELQRQQEELDQKIREKKEAEKKAVISQIVDVVNTYNIPIDELVDALGGLKIKRTGVKAVQKYQDPATGATWSGRGKEPLWIRGKDRKKFLIPA